MKEFLDLTPKAPVETHFSDEKTEAVRTTLLEVIPDGAFVIGSVYTQNSEQVLTVLDDFLLNGPRDAKESMYLGQALYAIDAATDSLALDLRAQLESDQRQRALRLLTETAYQSYLLGGAMGSYACNHLAGAIASGEVNFDDVAETLENSDGVRIFLEKLESRTVNFVDDTEYALDQIRKHRFFKKEHFAKEEILLEMYLECESKEEAYRLAEQIVSDSRHMRYVQIKLVETTFVDKNVGTEARHRCQERLLTLREAGEAQFRADPEKFLLEYLVPYRAGENGLTTTIVAYNDLMGNKDIPGILRETAKDELFREQSLQLMLEVSTANPEHSVIRQTLADMLKKGEVSDEELLVLGASEVIVQGLRKEQTMRAVEGAFIVPLGKELDLDLIEKIKYRAVHERVSSIYYELFHLLDLPANPASPPQPNQDDVIDRTVQEIILEHRANDQRGTGVFEVSYANIVFKSLYRRRKAEVTKAFCGKYYRALGEADSSRDILKQISDISPYPQELKEVVRHHPLAVQGYSDMVKSTSNAPSMEVFLSNVQKEGLFPPSEENIAKMLPMLSEELLRDMRAATARAYFDGAKPDWDVGSVEFSLRKIQILLKKLDLSVSSVLTEEFVQGVAEHLKTINDFPDLVDTIKWLKPLFQSEQFLQKISEPMSNILVGVLHDRMLMDVKKIDVLTQIVALWPPLDTSLSSKKISTSLTRILINQLNTRSSGITTWIKKTLELGLLTPADLKAEKVQAAVRTAIASRLSEILNDTSHSQQLTTVAELADTLVTNGVVSSDMKLGEEVHNSFESYLKNEISKGNFSELDTFMKFPIQLDEERLHRPEMASLYSQGLEVARLENPNSDAPYICLKYKLLPADDPSIKKWGLYKYR